MPHKWAEGKRDKHDLDTIEFQFHEVTSEDGKSTQHLWSIDGDHPVHLQTIYSLLDDMYTRTGREPVGRMLEKDETVLVTTFEPEGIVAVEDHELDQLVIRMESEAIQEFTDQIAERSQQLQKVILDMDSFEEQMQSSE